MALNHLRVAVFAVSLTTMMLNIFPIPQSSKHSTSWAANGFSFMIADVIKTDDFLSHMPVRINIVSCNDLITIICREASPYICGQRHFLLTTTKQAFQNYFLFPIHVNNIPCG